MVVVCAYGSRGSFSCVFRGRGSHAVQFLELGFFITICAHRDSHFAVPATARSSPNRCVDSREEGNERCGGVQRKVILHFSCSSRTGRTSFLPLHGRARRVLRRRLFLFVPRVSPTP